MAKQKAATKNQAAGGQTTNNGVEPMVIALAEQLGTFMGRVQKKADGWLENETLRQQVGQIRDSATQLLERVNKASAAARQTAAKVMPDVLAPSTRQRREGEKSPAVAGEKAAVASTVRASRGPVDAPGKRHRKPPPQESINKRMGEPRGKNAGQKQFKVGKSRGRG
jgi:hypothetical protein